MSLIAVDLNKALQNEYYARAVFCDYHYNSEAHKKYAISDQDIVKITAYWNKQGKVAQWRAEAAKDKTEYLIDGDDYSDAKTNGKNAAAKSVGYSGKKNYEAAIRGVAETGANVFAKFAIKGLVKKGVTTQVAKCVVEKAAGAAAKEVTKKAAKKAGKKVIEGAVKEYGATGITKIVAKSASKNASRAAAKEIAKGGTAAAAEKAGQEAGKKTIENAGKSVGCLIGCALALAEGIKAVAKPANKEQVEAARKLRESELPQGQNALFNAQADMLRDEEEIAALAEQAEEANEEANDGLEANKTEYDTYRQKLQELKDKIARGEQLTESEKQMYKELIGLLGEDGELVTENKELMEEASDIVSETADSIDDYQSNYDTNAETIAEVQGVTDYAAGFDETTKIMCFVEGGVQTLNAAFGTLSATKALAMAPTMLFGAAAAYAAAAAGFAGAGMSGIAAAQQFSWASEVGQEIDVREATQELGGQTMEFYEDSVDFYAESGEFTRGLELEVPKDMEGENADSLPANQPAQSPTDSNSNSPLLASTVPQEDPKKKPEDEEGKA